MKKTIVLILLSIIFPSVVFAETNEVIIDCPKSVKKDEEIKCDLTADFSYQIKGINYKYSYDQDAFSYVTFEPTSSWEALVEEGKIAVFAKEDINTKTLVGTLTFKSKKKNANPNIQPTEVIVNNDEYDDIVLIGENENRQENKKNELKKATTTSNNKLKYDIIIIIVVIVILLIMMGLIIIKIIRSDTK